MEDQLRRAGSSVWHVTTSSTAKGSAPTPPRAGQRALPSEPADRARYLYERACEDIQARRFGSAETNLRLALTWDRRNPEYTLMLEHVCLVRREERSL